MTVQALDAADLARTLRYQHRMTVEQTAEMLGVSMYFVRKHAPGDNSRYLRTSDLRRMRELRYVDGLTAREVADRLGISRSTVERYAPGRPGKVPNDPLREAFLASGVSASDVARALGWWVQRNHGRYAGQSFPDVSRVRRTLGLRDDRSRGYRRARRLIDAEVCASIADAIGVMPWEVMPDDDEVAA